MNDPIFRSVAATHRFTALPTEYTDRFTPEVARQQGERAGACAALNLAIDMLGEVKKPSKQILSIIDKLREIADEQA